MKQTNRGLGFARDPAAVPFSEANKTLTPQTSQTVPEILTIDELVKLMNAIPEPFRTAVFLDSASGLRVGELLGLKWEDVDFKKSVIYIRRSIVKQRIGPPKTEASQKPIPTNAELAKSLRLWKMKTIYNRPGDWVYASPAKKGMQPYWLSS